MTYALRQNSVRLSSIGEIAWKVERSDDTATHVRFSVGSGIQRSVRLYDEEFVVNVPISRRLEPIRYNIVGVIPSAKEWRLRKPLPIEVNFDGDGTVIVTDSIFNRYGVGESIEKAISEFLDNLFVYFEIVQEYTNENRPANQAILAHLQEYIVSSTK